MVVLSVCIEEGPVFSDSLQIWGITYVLGLTVSKVAILTWNILSFHKGMYLLVWLYCFIYLENSIVWCEIFFCSKLTVIIFISKYYYSLVFGGVNCTMDVWLYLRIITIFYRKTMAFWLSITSHHYTFLFYALGMSVMYLGGDKWCLNV